MLTKLNAEGSRWSKAIRAKKKLLLFHEEYQNESWEKELVLLKDMQAAILVGDPWQAPLHEINHEHKKSPDSQAAVGQHHVPASSRESPLRGHPTFQWARDNPSVQKLVSTETFRTSEPGLTVLRNIFPEFLTDCTAGDNNHTTHYLPVLAHGVTDWRLNQSQENVASGVLFSAVLLIVALELVVATSSGQQISIAVHGFLLSTIEALEQYLTAALPSMCEHIRNTIGVECEDTYEWSVSKLKHQQILLFRGPYNVGGLNAVVSIPLIPRHSDIKQGWRGLVAQTPLLYSALSRGSRRIYPVMEDLRWDLVVPSKSGDNDLDSRVRKLGLVTTAKTLGRKDKWIKTQVALSHTCAVFEKVLADNNCAKWLTLQTPLNFHSRFPSILASDVLQSLLNIPVVQWESHMKTALAMYDALKFDWVRLQRNEQNQSIDQFFGTPNFQELMYENDTNMDTHPSTRAPDLKRYDYNADSGPDANWLAGFWTKLMIDSVAVTITSDKEAIVQIPLAARLPRVGDLAREEKAKGVDWSDPCYLARAISRLAYDALMEHFTSADWFEDTTLSCCMRAHKNTELFIGPEIFFVPLCRSDRPAYIIDAEVANSEAATGKTIELLHMYPCMGLEHAHEVQQVLLARCKNHDVAAAVVFAASCNFGFEYKRNLVHYYIDDPVSKQSAEKNWDEIMHTLCLLDQSRPIPTDSRGDLKAEDVCLLEECLEIAQKHRSDQAVPSTPQVTPAGGGQDYVRWVHTTGLARVPATEILPRCFAGTVDHVLSFEWLRRNCITHVLCLLGQHQLPLVQASRYNTIFYLDWSINFPPHFKLIPEVFHSMRQILADNGTRLLVHCKNGTDRTALALFGYLMFNGYDEQDALAKLDARKGTDGNPIMNVSANNSFPAFRQMFEAWLLVANVT
jgi:hypothetical protein